MCRLQGGPIARPEKVVKYEKPDIVKLADFFELNDEHLSALDEKYITAWDCHPLCPVRLLDEQSGDRSSTRISNLNNPKHGRQKSRSSYVVGDNSEATDYRDSGGASRFFYHAKVSTRERNIGGIDCKHPTLKPIDLCRYLATLLLPPPRPSDTRKLLVPFSGAGSEVAGSLLAGWDDVTGIEQDAEYVQWSEARVQAVLRGELQEKGSGSRSRRGRSTGSTGGTVDTIDTKALADLFTEG